MYHSLSSQAPVQTFVGVAFCGNTVEEAKLLIDRVKGYTNLYFAVRTNQQGRKRDYPNLRLRHRFWLKHNCLFWRFRPENFRAKNLEWRATWTSTAKERYGERFLGIYYYDERGGIYLDTDKNATNWRLPPNATYSSVAASFVNGFLREGGTVYLKDENIPIFASDYALYWFDYLSGYDVMLTQIGWNHSLIQDIALIRGAARMQNKDWGAIITWKYNQPPYLDSGEAIYQQMLTSYRAGAKYITIFNYPYSRWKPVRHND